MAKKVKFGWLKDKIGERFAPKTFTSLVFNKNGKTLEKIIEELSEKDSVEVIGTADVGQCLVVKEVDKTGKPVKWECVEKQDHIQADYNQNDSTKPDYIKNKPFYEEILFDKDVVFSGGSESAYNFGEQLFANGTKYNVQINDVSFVIECGGRYKLYLDEYVYESIGENFYLENDSMTITYPRRTDFHVRISVFRTLDEKFIPDNIPKVSTASVGQVLEVEEVDENGKPTKWKVSDKSSGGLGVMFVQVEYDEANGRNYVSNYNEIRDAWNNGVLVVICFGSYLYLPQYVSTTSLAFGCVTYSGGLSAELAHVLNDGTVELFGATLLTPTEAYIDVSQEFLYIGDYNNINFEFENVTISNKSFSVSVDETLFFELQDFLIYISTHHYVLQYYDAQYTPIVSIRGFGTLQTSESEIILKLQDYTLTIYKK